MQWNRRMIQMNQVITLSPAEGAERLILGAIQESWQEIQAPTNAVVNETLQRATLAAGLTISQTISRALTWTMSA
jgi:hypothetical protein